MKVGTHPEDADARPSPTIRSDDLELLAQWVNWLQVRYAPAGDWLGRAGGVTASSSTSSPPSGPRGCLCTDRTNPLSRQQYSSGTSPPRSAGSAFACPSATDRDARPSPTSLTSP